MLIATKKGGMHDAEVSAIEFARSEANSRWNHAFAGSSPPSLPDL